MSWEQDELEHKKTQKIKLITATSMRDEKNW